MTDKLPDVRGGAGYDIQSQPVVVAGSGYESIAASQTDQVLGSTGEAGDILNGILVIPASGSPGAISIKDGSNAALTNMTTQQFKDYVDQVATERNRTPVGSITAFVNSLLISDGAQSFWDFAAANGLVAIESDIN